MTYRWRSGTFVTLSGAILSLLLVGFLWTIRAGTGAGGSRIWVSRMMSLVYGVGSALTLDEFALWLNLRDVYWEREGGTSFEAMALFGRLLAMAVFGAGFFRRLGGRSHP